MASRSYRMLHYQRDHAGWIVPFILLLNTGPFEHSTVSKLSGSSIGGGDEVALAFWNVATSYGVGGFLFLLLSESLLLGLTICMCFGRPLALGGSRAWTIIYFASSCATFLVAEAYLIARATKNAYDSKYWNMIYTQNFLCEKLRKGMFVVGAVFVVGTIIL